MVKLLVYGYCTGKTSSRKIEKATWEDVGYRVLSGNQQPDHDSIADFRRRHLKALAGLFVQVLKLCQEAGLVKLGHVSVKLRKSIVEPVFGQIKQARGFRQFSFRGLEKVTAEWNLVALTHNLLKLFRSGWRKGVGQASRVALAGNGQA